LADLLSRLRFDVFLDRFRLAPGVDFVERIVDELVDKAMIVAVDTRHAVRSSWVRHEVATAVNRRLEALLESVWHSLSRTALAPD
jgi:TIR domain